jgi:phosphoribosyl 1,2-cyclic phosphodiesterase
VLASGSTGNAAFLATSKTRILIDAGLSVRDLTHRLAEIGEKPEDIDAVLITHEHSDHVSGLARFIRWRARKNKSQNKPVKVFVSRLTAPTLDWESPEGEGMESTQAAKRGFPGTETFPRQPRGARPPCAKFPEGIERFQAGSGWMVGNVAVESFTIPHDAIDPVGFCLHAEGVKIGIATDLGYVPESIKVHLRRVQILVIESNHDLDMLKVGPYPWSVKQRVMGRNGHLSNAVTCDFVENDLDGGVQTLILGHLSEQNNHPEIVRMGAEQSLLRRGLRPRLVIAEQRKPTEVFQY